MAYNKIDDTKHTLDVKVDIRPVAAAAGAPAAAPVARTLPEALGRLLSSSTHQLSDVTFIVGANKKAVPAHRLFVAARSTGFERLLFPKSSTAQTPLPAPDTKTNAPAPAMPAAAADEKSAAAKDEKSAPAEEKPKPKPEPKPIPFDAKAQSGPASVELPDVDAAAFEIMLKYMYTGDSSALTDANLPDCIALARRFVVPSFRQCCLDFVDQHPAPHTVCALLAVDDFDSGFACAYLEDEAGGCAAAPNFISLPRARIVNWIRSKHLSRISEADAIAAVRRWAEAELKRRGKPTSNAAINAELGAEITNHFRFSLLTAEQIQRVIVPSGLLTADQLSLLYAYVAAKSAAQAAIASVIVPGAAPAANAKSTSKPTALLPKLPADWSRQIRTARHPAANWRWDRAQSHSATSIILSTNQRTINSAHSPYTFARIYGTASWSRHALLKLQSDFIASAGAAAAKDVKDAGIVQWEITITSYDKTTGPHLALGIVPAYDESYTATTIPGVHLPPDANGVIASNPGWMLLCGDGTIVSKATGLIPFTGAFKVGDRIGFRLNICAALDAKTGAVPAGTLEIYRNGVSAGVAFKDITGPVKPAIAFTGIQSVSTKIACVTLN